jgi:antitoxin ParD1/3/4
MDRQHDEHVSLNPEQADFVKHQVESGAYKSSSDVVNDGLRVLEEMDQFVRSRRKEIHAKIREGLDAAKRGEVVGADEVWAELDRLDAEAAKKKRSA